MRGAAASAPLAPRGRPAVWAVGCADRPTPWRSLGATRPRRPPARRSGEFGRPRDPAMPEGSSRRFGAGRPWLPFGSFERVHRPGADVVDDEKVFKGMFGRAAVGLSAGALRPSRPPEFRLGEQPEAGLLSPRPEELGRTVHGGPRIGRRRDDAWKAGHDGQLVLPELYGGDATEDVHQGGGQQGLAYMNLHFTDGTALGGARRVGTRRSRSPAERRPGSLGRPIRNPAVQGRRPALSPGRTRSPPGRPSR